MPAFATWLPAATQLRKAVVPVDPPGRKRRNAGPAPLLKTVALRARAPQPLLKPMIGSASPIVLLQLGSPPCVAEPFMLTVRVVLAGSVPTALRVSTRRHGGIVWKRRPEVPNP